MELHRLVRDGERWELTRVGAEVEVWRCADPSDGSGFAPPDVTRLVFADPAEAVAFTRSTVRARWRAGFVPASTRRRLVRPGRREAIEAALADAGHPYGAFVSSPDHPGRALVHAAVFDAWRPEHVGAAWVGGFVRHLYLRALATPDALAGALSRVLDQPAVWLLDTLRLDLRPGSIVRWSDPYPFDERFDGIPIDEAVAAIARAVARAEAAGAPVFTAVSVRIDAGADAAADVLARLPAAIPSARVEGTDGAVARGDPWTEAAPLPGRVAFDGREVDHPHLGDEPVVGDDDEHAHAYPSGPGASHASYRGSGYGDGAWERVWEVVPWLADFARAPPIVDRRGGLSPDEAFDARIPADDSDPDAPVPPWESEPDDEDDREPVGRRGVDPYVGTVP